MQAWQEWCSSKEHRCRHQGGIPEKAYVISLPVDSEKRDYLLPHLRRLGLEPEIVNGIPENQVTLMPTPFQSILAASIVAVYIADPQSFHLPAAPSYSLR